VAIGADQPYAGSTCAVTRVQAWFGSGHVVDGDLDRVLSEEAHNGVASVAAVRVGCWAVEQQQVMPDAGADVEDAGILVCGLEVIKGRPVAGMRAAATDALMVDGGTVWVADPGL
jgi:hypothetical protein